MRKILGIAAALLAGIARTVSAGDAMMLTQMTHGRLAQQELCCVTQSVRNEASKLILARDADGLAQLLAGRVAFLLDKGTEVRGIDEEMVGWFSRSIRVRVLSGPNRGASCWTDPNHIPAIADCASNIDADSSHDCIPSPEAPRGGY